MVSSNAFVLNFQTQLLCQKSNTHPTLVLSLEIAREQQNKGCKPQTLTFHWKRERTARQGLQTSHID